MSDHDNYISHFTLVKKGIIKDMKLLRYTLYSFLCFSLLSCSSDDDNPTVNELRYDGENFTSPFIDAGNHEAAARFRSAETGPFIGKQLTAVEVFLYDIPASIFLNIYTSGSAAGPDIPLIREEITSGVRANALNRITLNPPLDITPELWLSVSWSQNSNQQVIGCDQGPANPNGDWIFVSTNQNGWTSLRETNGESVNWNIRGIVSD